jgi:hypothetical protein
MKIGIAMPGVSYDDGSIYRYRNYEESINSFYEFIVNPLRKEGHEVFFYIYTYDTIKTENIKKDFFPIKKFQFINQKAQILNDGLTVQNHNLIECFNMMLDENLDLVIKARFDIKFLKNPFEAYSWDFNKINFLWREPLMEDLPLVNDVFFTFPYKFINHIIDSFLECELNPHNNIRIALHNIYNPLLKRIDKNEISWVDNRFVSNNENDLYILNRKA